MPSKVWRVRNIQRDLIEFLDSKLLLNGLAQHAIAEQDARTVFRLAMESLVGVREVGANNSGPIVEMLQKTIGDASGEPWCMSTVQSCLAYAEFKCRTVSPIYASESCLAVWQRTPPAQRCIRMPLPGAIVIWQHVGTSNGHTGCLLEVSDTLYMKTVEGNTEAGMSPSGEVVREGGGVYIAQRFLSGTRKMAVVGFLKPF